MHKKRLQTWLLNNDRIIQRQFVVQSSILLASSHVALLLRDHEQYTIMQFNKKPRRTIDKQGEKDWKCTVHIYVHLQT